MMSVALADHTSVRTGELENGGTPEGYGCEGACGGGSTSENGAEGGIGVGEEREATCRLYTDSDDEDSSVLEDLRAMFPLLDEEVLTTILQAHEGRVEGAIDYLMLMNSQQVEEPEPEPALQSFSEDIGGLPELIPSFVYEDEEDEEEFDPLPSYDEIYPPLEPGPPPYSPPSQDHLYPPSTRSVLADNFSLPHTTSLPQVYSPSLAPSRDPPQIETPALALSRDPPQADSSSRDLPQDSPSRDPPQDSPSRDPPQTDSPSRDPPQTDSPRRDLPQADSPSRDPPQTDSPRRDPPQTDSPSRDPPQTDSPSRDPPQADCTTMPACRDPQADSSPPFRDPPSIDNPSLTPNGDHQLQDISSSVGGDRCSTTSTADLNGRCQRGFQGRHENDVSLPRSGKSEQPCNRDISSDEDFDHRDGWQSLAGEESPNWSDRSDSTSSSRSGRRHRLRKFAKKLSLRKSSKSDYKAVQESFEAKSHPLPYLPLVVDDELSDEVPEYCKYCQPICVMAGSRSTQDEDGFQLVRRRGGRTPHPPPWKPQEYIGPEAAVLCEQLNSVRKVMEGSDFYQELAVLLQKAPCVWYVFREIVCYGIGHIGSCRQAQHQFALLLALVDHCKPVCAWVFDPALCEEELQVVQELGCLVISKNELCKRAVSCPTLFLMPHCGKAMYNNLLWANWSPEGLARVVIIGNSFRSYTERLPMKHLAQEASFIYHISSYCLELPLPCYHPEPNAFSDTSLHLFPPETLSTVPAGIWSDCSEPPLDPKDPEIIVT